MVAAAQLAYELHTRHDKKKQSALQAAVQKLGLGANVLRALRARVDRLCNPKSKVPRPTLLTQECEQHLVELVSAFSVHANALAGVEVRTVAAAMFGLDQIPTTGWLATFLERNKAKLKICNTRPSHKKDVLLGLFQSLVEWTKETEKKLAHVAAEPSCVFNIDETRAIPASKVHSVIASAQLTQVQYESAMNSTLYTLVGCYTADGTTLFVLYIFKARFTKNGPRQDFYVPTLSSQGNTQCTQRTRLFCM